MMIFQEPLEGVIRRRRSVRTYEAAILTSRLKEDIQQYAEGLTTPFGVKPLFKLVEKELEPNGAKLGTYGMVKGASVFMTAAVADTAFAIEALGYAFEQLILYLTTLGLGTCWLGGTFNRGEFRKALGSGDQELLFPAISPVGYADRLTLKERMVRGLVRADSRLPWSALFFDGSFEVPLTVDGAEDLATPLEMVRLGPSASNKQPWRILKLGRYFHFYEQKTPGYSKAFNFDMQAIDMGIAACHFHLTATEQGKPGQFVFNAGPELELPQNMVYKYSWEIPG